MTEDLIRVFYHGVGRNRRYAIFLTFGYSYPLEEGIKTRHEANKRRTCWRKRIGRIPREEHQRIAAQLLRLLRRMP